MTRDFKVLVVDDEPDIVRYLEHVLHRLGYETASAGDGVQAIEKAAADPPALILLDVMMPVMDGFAVCRRRREREATRLIPVIVMTALAGIENRVKLLEHGADDVLAKPVDERELVARVQGGAGPEARGRSPAGRSGPGARPFRQVRARGGPPPRARQPGRARARQARARRDRALRRHQRLRPAGRERRSRRPERARRALLRQLPGPHHRRGGRYQRDLRRRLHGHLPGRRSGRPRRAHRERGAHAAGAHRGAQPEGARAPARHPHRHQLRAGPGRLPRFEGRRGTRWTFTASGIVTTMAARLAAAASDGDILAGPETVRRLGGRYRLERVGRERLKNLSEAIEVHRIISPPSRR